MPAAAWHAGNIWQRVGADTALRPVPAEQNGLTLHSSGAFHIHLPNRESVLARAHDLIDMVLRGKVRISVDRRYPLADAAQAHIDIESGATTGMSVLVP